MVNLEKLKRFSAQMAESVHKITIRCTLPSFGFYERVARIQLLLEEAMRSSVFSFPQAMGKMIFWSYETKIELFDLKVKGSAWRKLNTAHYPGRTMNYYES